MYLENHVFTITEKKEQNYVREERVIMDVALPYWQETIEKAEPNQYIISRMLKPGSKLLDEIFIYRRWKKHVQQDLGITATWYNIKSLSLEEIAEALTMQDAANTASHKGKMITMKHYAKKQAEIQRKKEMKRI